MKPKKLTLREIHNLYLLLRHCLPHKEEEYLIDEIEKMVGMMEGEEVLVKSLDILYRKKKTNNPVEMIFLFVRGLKENKFFDYVLFVNGIKNGKRAS